jgi:hypothetical protein
MTTTPDLNAVLNFPTPMSVCSVIQSPLLECIMQVIETEMTNPSCTNEKLIEIRRAMRQVAELWVNELITDKEITDSFARVSVLYAHYERLGLLKGLLDPNTGLKY